MRYLFYVVIYLTKVIFTKVCIQNVNFTFRFTVPGPCRPIAVGKSLQFDEAKKSPPPSKPRKISKLNTKLINFAEVDSDNLFEVDSDDLDGEEKENFDVTMEQVPDFHSPIMRVTRSTMSRTKLFFD